MLLAGTKPKLPKAAHAEIGQHLRFVRRHESGNRFDFDNHLAIYENVGAEAFVESDPLSNDRDSELPLKGDSSLCQLARKQHTVLPPC